MTSLWSLAAMLVVMLFGAAAEASHFRYATINWNVPDPVMAPRTVRFVIQHAWRLDTFQDTLTFNFGDGATATQTFVGQVGMTPPRIVMASAGVTGGVIGTGVDAGGAGYVVFEMIVSRTYAGTATEFTAFFSSCCRISGLQNGAGDANYRIETRVSLAGGNTGGPVTATLPVLPLQNGGVRTFGFPATDPDGDVVTCRFATGTETGLPGGAMPFVPFVPAGGARPMILGVMGGRCELSWNLAMAVVGQRYVLHFMLESTRGGVVSRTPTDLVIEIVARPPPTCVISGTMPASASATVPAFVGTPITRTITGTQAMVMAGDNLNLTLSATGLPMGATLTPAMGTQLSPFSTVFNWTPSAADQGRTVVVQVLYRNTNNGSGACSLSVQVPICTNTGMACAVGVGACRRMGTLVQCMPGGPLACNVAAGTPVMETCNNVDDNCDGMTDEMNANCTGATPICNSTMMRCVGCTNDMQCMPGQACSAMGTCVDRDTDMDTIPDRLEFGPGGAGMPRDTDMDGIPDFRDPDDDNDNVLTRDELGAGGFMMPRNSDSTVPAGEGTADMLPDYLDPDDDGDGVPTRTERGTGAAPTNSDTDMLPDFLDRDDDGDTVPTAAELGGNPMMPRNTDAMLTGGDMLPDYLDVDDDADSILTSVEVGAGGFRMPTNTDAMLMGGDANPDFIDPDDDGDGVPTRTERTAGILTNHLNQDSDADTIPDNVELSARGGAGPFSGINTEMTGGIDALDTDSDGDGVLDSVEAGPMPRMPVDTDTDGTADFRDLDSDNDCRPDAMEMGAARIDARMPNVNADANCTMALPFCNTAVGACTADRDTDMDGIGDLAEFGPGGSGMPRDSDMDGIPDFRDPDDDGDGVLTRVELGPGGFMMPRNSDGTVPMGEGTADMIPDYLDPDDDGDGVPTLNETGADPTMPRDTDMDGTPDFRDRDDDGDSIATAAELGMGGFMMPRNSDSTVPMGEGTSDMNPDYLDADDDGDGVPTINERNMGMDRDTDMDMTPDHLDRDDDGDTLPTAAELGMGGFMMPRNTDAMVPMAEGTADMVPDYLDRDDDGDGIPTPVELRLEPMPAIDMDGVPAHLDTDSDGDGVFDRVEAGADPTMPANSDPMAAMGDLPDFLDLDSDNDCLPDSDMREAGAARTDPRMPSESANTNCMAPTSICSAMLGRCVSPEDMDGDGIPDADERRLGTNPMNPDSDMDGIPDGREVGPGPMFMGRDTDMDGMIDALDPDDDGDGIPTRDELGADAMMPRNTDGSVPMGMGTSDMIPDYLDADDDGDGIPTRTERMAEGMMDLDMDMTPAHRDLDSDGDGVADSVEAGAMPGMPADTDRDGNADFLDRDSDNDCLPDNDMREAGGARIDPAMPSAMASGNCMDPTPVCDTMRGVCVSTMPDGGMPDGGSQDASRDGGASDGGAMDGGAPFVGVLSGDGACGCRVPAAPSSDERGVVAMLGLGALGLVLGARRARGRRKAA
jgi:hypothetical protein